MNKFALKIWLISKMEHIDFQIKYKTIKPDSSNIPVEALESQLRILKDLYEDFNMEDVDISYLQGPK